MAQRWEPPPEAQHPPVQCLRTRWPCCPLTPGFTRFLVVGGPSRNEKYDFRCCHYLKRFWPSSPVLKCSQFTNLVRQGASGRVEEHYSGQTPLWIYPSLTRDQTLDLCKAVENTFLSDLSEVTRIILLTVWVWTTWESGLMAVRDCSLQDTFWN